jgi:FemAB-related protein (PEP-CTERM system-associated)
VLTTVATLVEVRELQAGRQGDEAAWDRFVRKSPDGTAFHLLAWRRVVERVFRYAPHYLMAVEGGEVRAILPLFAIRGILSGRVLVSVPFGVYGGLCGADAGARRLLLQHARALGDRLGVRHIELRHLDQPETGLPTKSLYATFMKPMAETPDANMAGIPAKQRRMIRQGIKHGLEARSGWEWLRPFYAIYLANRRHLGSPPFPLGLFEAIRDEYAEESGLLTVWHEGRLVAGVISLFHRDRVMPYYGAADPGAFELAANDFMYWALMRQACLDGYRVFDFGRSREGAGAYHFKRHWGFTPQPLPYQYVFVNGRDIPNVSPSNPRFRVLIRTWKQLPLGVTGFLGPALARWLPLD